MGVGQSLSQQLLRRASAIHVGSGRDPPTRRTARLPQRRPPRPAHVCRRALGRDGATSWQLRRVRDDRGFADRPIEAALADPQRGSPSPTTSAWDSLTPGGTAARGCRRRRSGERRSPRRTASEPMAYSSARGPTGTPRRGAARGDRPASAAVLRADRRPRHRGARHRRGDRGARRDDPRARRARRRGAHLRAVLRLVRGGGRTRRGATRDRAARVAAFAPDPDRIRSAFSDRTRIVLVNDPHNPTGSVLDRATRELIVELATRHDAWIVTDEVYEHLRFGTPHEPIATLPGAADRTITISSGGKTFSATGWKIGWLHARADLVTAILSVKQYLTYVNGAPFQPAIAVGLDLPDSVLRGHRDRPAGGPRHPDRRAPGCRPRRLDARGLVLRDRRRPAARSGRLRGVLPRTRDNGRGRRHPGVGVRGPPGDLRGSRAVRVLQATRSADRGRSAAGALRK